MSRIIFVLFHLYLWILQICFFQMIWQNITLIFQILLAWILYYIVFYLNNALCLMIFYRTYFNQLRSSSARFSYWIQKIFLLSYFLQLSQFKSQQFSNLYIKIKSMRSSLLFILFCLLGSQVILTKILLPNDFKSKHFTETISGDLSPLKPVRLSSSNYWPYPVEVYQIAAMRANHQFLPKGLPSTEIFAFAGKKDGKFYPSFPGPTILAFKNTPIYIVYTNNIEGKHLFPLDNSPPFDMMAHYFDQVPIVPHIHGLETQMGSDGQPLGFWTKSGRKGPDFFSLNDAKRKKNQAIFRYHNTKEGLFWWHDHTMGITRLNVYAGLVGLYQIIDPTISLQEKNLIKIFGNVPRKYFAINDKSFNTDGSLYYPDKAQSSSFKTWVPQFFGNTIVVNGKVWPKIVLQPKKYRFIFLNGCQSRYLNIFFEHKNTNLPFHIFRRDSDFLRRPIKLKSHLLLVGGRIQIFVDFTGLQGTVLLRNNAVTPYPMGKAPDQFTSQILKIQLQPRGRVLQQQPTQNQIQQKVSAEQIKINEVQNQQPAILSDSQQHFDQQLTQTMQELQKGQTMSQVGDFKDNLNLNNQEDGIHDSYSTDFKVQDQFQTLLDQLQRKVRFLSVNRDDPIFDQSDLNFIDQPQIFYPFDNGQPVANPQHNIITIQDFIESTDPRNAESLSIIQQYMKPNPSFNFSKFNDLISSYKNTVIKKATPFQAQSKLNIQDGQFSVTAPNTISDVPYPKFNQGTNVYISLVQLTNSKGQITGMMFDGVGLQQGCKGSIFKQGQVYDFYLINLTMDDHPIHIHLVNFQIIGRFKLDHKKYKSDFEKKNGKLGPRGYINKIPKQLDPRPYKTSQILKPDQQQKLFMDVIRVPQSQVTIARVKFANHLGHPFPFNISGGKYVQHCHILQHQDNQMMRYFCIQ